MDEYMRELEGKINLKTSKHCIWVPSPIIIGAGPSGLATAACLKENGVPSLILERSNCIASLWQQRTYDRLKLHLPKQFCELPLMAFPEDYPTYPTRQQFIEYLEEYAKRFEIQPVFNQTVVRAELDQKLGLWRVSTAAGVGYMCPWLVVATGENAEEVVPVIEGIEGFEGTVMHSSQYRNGDDYRGKRVVVVGCGNSGMEVALDLCNHKAITSLVVRDTIHVLPREMFGGSTFGLSMWLLKWFPIRLVDRLLLALSRLIIGDTSRFGLDRPQLGPLELKNLFGKTPVIDVGTFDKIKSGDIKVLPGIKIVRQQHVEFADGRREKFDAIILATGFKSNVPSWLKESKMFCEKDGVPRSPFPNGWKGEKGLYAVGFTKRGLLGASMDAKNIAEDIRCCWRGRIRNLENHFSLNCKGKVKATLT